MKTGRLEAFSDGVIAILITIMVLELKVPHGTDWSALRPLLPVFLTYLLSFVYLGIYWNNHHHLMHVTERLNGKILWANLHLLFWLSLTPFVTGWMGENHFAAIPTAAYGAVQTLAGVSYYILVRTILANHGPDSKVAQAIGEDVKGKISVALYAASIRWPSSTSGSATAFFVAVALIWLVPDPRIERRMSGD
jgi:uncharacterized membrane protein